MELNPLESILKGVFIGIEVVINLVTRKREEALVAYLENYDQRLQHLEDKLEKL